MQRTKDITESVEAIVEISDASVEILQRIGQSLSSSKGWWGDKGAENEEFGQIRSVIKCNRAPVVGFWKITFLDVIGVVDTPDLRFNIAPKIPLNHFAYIVENAFYEPRNHETEISLGHNVTFVNLMCTWFMKKLESLISNGLMQDYKLIENELLNVKGKIKVISSINNWYSGNLKQVCEYSEFDLDNSANRMLLAAAKVISRNANLSPSLRLRASRAVSGMYGVQELQPNDLVVSERNLWPHYKAALSLAKQVILGNGVDLISGNTSGNAFLIRTPEIVENGIRSMLNAHFNSPVYLEKRRLSLKIAPTEMSLTPDLLFRIGDYHQRNAVHSERRITLSTGDVKYKVNRGEWDRSDLYQAIAFASAFQARSGIILTFGKPVMNSKAVLRIGEMSFSQFTWNFELNAKPEDAKLALVSDLDSYFDEILNIQAAELTKPLSL